MGKANITKPSEERLDAIEAHLAGTLKPVTPRQDFVRHLRGRIHLPARDEIAVRLRDWRTLLLVFGGVFSGALVVLTVARALFHLFGRRNMG
jgi:hypothetical protein